MSNLCVNKRATRKSQFCKAKPCVDIYSLGESQMELEDSPVKVGRCRSSTIGYESPNTISLKNGTNQKTCGGSVKTQTGTIKQTDASTFTAEVHLVNTLSKLKDMKMSPFMPHHNIQEKFRAKMFDWMIEVLLIFQQRESTIFKAMFLLDYFYHSSEEAEALEDLHITGMACMLIASKSEEVEFIKVESFLDVVGKGKFSREELLNRELKVLEVIKFKTSLPTIHDIIKCTFAIAHIEQPEIEGFVERGAFLLSKMCLFSQALVSNLEIFEIALFSLVIALKLSEKVRPFDSSLAVR